MAEKAPSKRARPATSHLAPSRGNSRNAPAQLDVIGEVLGISLVEMGRNVANGSSNHLDALDNITRKLVEIGHWSKIERALGNADLASMDAIRQSVERITARYTSDEPGGHRTSLFVIPMLVSTQEAMSADEVDQFLCQVRGDHVSDRFADARLAEHFRGMAVSEGVVQSQIVVKAHPADVFELARNLCNDRGPCNLPRRADVSSAGHKQRIHLRFLLGGISVANDRREWPLDDVTSLLKMASVAARFPEWLNDRLGGIRFFAGTQTFGMQPYYDGIWQSVVTYEAIRLRLELEKLVRSNGTRWAVTIACHGDAMSMLCRITFFEPEDHDAPYSALTWCTRGGEAPRGIVGMIWALLGTHGITNVVASANLYPPCDEHGFPWCLTPGGLLVRPRQIIDLSVD
jgi:hypothetical protein